MAVVRCHVLIAFLGPNPVAGLFVCLSKLVERVGPALRALAKLGEAGDRQIGPAHFIQIRLAQQTAGEIPGILFLGGGKFLRFMGISVFKNSA